MNILSQDIVKDWNISGLPETKQQQMIEELGRLLYQALLVKSLDILSQEEQDELDKLLDLDTTTPQDVLLFLKSKIPTFEQLVREERAQLKEDMLARM